MQPMHPEDAPTEVISAVATMTEAPTRKNPARKPPVNQRRQERVIQMARWIVVTVILINLVGLGSIWGVNAYSTSRHATRDLAAHLTTIQAILQRSDLFTSTNLTQLQTEIASAEGDLAALDGIIPLRGVIGSSQIERLHHSLLMCRDFLQAAQGLTQSILIIEPHLQTFLLSALAGTPPQQAAPLTLDEIHQAQRSMHTSLLAWQSAQNERQLVGLQPIKGALGIPTSGINLLAGFLATFADRFTLILNGASAVLDNLFLLLGAESPGHLLLAMADPDQARPSGGAIGAYADVEVTNGIVTTGTTFQDINHLDCPHACARNATLPQYAWYVPQNGEWGVRDSDLDPQFQQSGNLLHDLYLAETGISVDGVMQFTPVLLQQILQIMGPVMVSGLHITVTPKNLTQAIYREHQKALELAQAHQTASAAIPTYDELFVNSIMASLANASSDQLHHIGQAMLHDLMTKDVQLSTIYGRLAAQLHQLGADGSLSTSFDDSLQVVDANLGQNFTSASVTEHISDHITLDWSGTAKHALTVTYAYPTPASLDPPVGPFEDLVQVIVPEEVKATSISGSCKKVAITLDGSTDLACRFSLQPGASMSLHFSWESLTSSHGRSYQLLVQRQTGASQDYAITAVAANGGRLMTTSAGGRATHDTVTWSRSPLLSDEELFVKEV